MRADTSTSLVTESITTMTNEEEREKKRKRIRNHIAKDLHSPKYRQRKLPKKRKGGRNDRQTDEDIRLLHKHMSIDVVDDFDGD